MYWERKVAPGAVSRRTGNALCNPQRAFFVLALMVLLLTSMTSCGRSQSAMSDTNDDYEVLLATDPAPPDQGMGTVILMIQDKQGQGVDAAQVSIEANMNHAGMKPEHADSTIGANGEYRLPINWTMGGAWYVDVTFTLHNGEVVRRRFPVDVK